MATASNSDIQDYVFLYIHTKVRAIKYKPIQYKGKLIYLSTLNIKGYNSCNKIRVSDIANKQ